MATRRDADATARARARRGRDVDEDGDDGGCRGGKRAVRRRGHSARGRERDEGGLDAMARRGATRARAQKTTLEVNLAEGRGLVATEDIKRGEALLGVRETTLITVERAIAEAKLGPKHAALQEWSVLATFLAQQALALERGEAGDVRGVHQSVATTHGERVGLAGR